MRVKVYICTVSLGPKYFTDEFLFVLALAEVENHFYHTVPRNRRGESLGDQLSIVKDDYGKALLKDGKRFKINACFLGEFESSSCDYVDVMRGLFDVFFEGNRPLGKELTIY